MKKSVFIIILFLITICINTYSTPPLEQPIEKLEKGKLQNEELAILDHALKSINLTRKDLGYKKDYVDDPFRLKAVQKSLDDPLYMVDWNYDWDAFLLEEKSISSILKKIATNLDSDRKMGS